MDWTPKKFWFNSRPRQEIFLFSKVTRAALGPNKPSGQWVTMSSFTREGSSWGMKLASHLHSVPRLRMHVAIPPFAICLNNMHNDNSAYSATMD